VLGKEIVFLDLRASIIFVPTKTKLGQPSRKLLQCVPCDPELDSRQHRTSVPVVLRLTPDTTRCPRSPVAAYDRTPPSASRCKARQMSREMTKSNVKDRSTESTLKSFSTLKCKHCRAPRHPSTF